MDGIIVINKEKGCTSHDIVYKVKKILNEKVGHTGTLDPNATGVLPLLIGKGTMMSKYLINHDKIYEATIKLGEKRDTADSEGNIIEEKEVKKEQFQEKNIKKALDTFKGKQIQIPPIYSAIKVNGKKLYEYARKGEEVKITPREIEIYDIELISINKEEKEIIFKVECSKGTYIRSLCEDIAKKLQTVGYMKELKRLKVGEFAIENSITMQQLKENIENQSKNEFLEKNFISLEKFFNNKENITLDEKKLKHFLNGVQITYKKQDEIYKIYNEQKQFIGTGTIKKQRLKRDIII